MLTEEREQESRDHHLPTRILELFGGKKHIRFFVPAIAQGNLSRNIYLAIH
jgi:hypothetical protein